MNGELFPDLHCGQRDMLGPEAWILRGDALAHSKMLLAVITNIVAQAPWRYLRTPGGRPMSVSCSSCGYYGWTSDESGYRYCARDPLSGKPWPALPASLAALATRAAADAGFSCFVPDTCLINRYLPGARMGLHQDRDEHHLDAPIVSISLGMSANFLFGGPQRSDVVRRTPLLHGDIVVWGGVNRLCYHGILPVYGNPHPRLGAQRINLTLRRAR